MKRIGDVLKKTPEQMMKTVFLKQYPSLADSEFDIKTDLEACISCGELKIPFYSIKREKDTEFKRVPMEPGLCISCEDKQLAKSTVEIHKKMKLKEKSAQFWHIPAELENQSLQTYKPEDQQQTEAFKKAVEYLKDFKKGDRYNLILRGSYGAGKSHLAKGIAEAIKESTYADQDGDQVPYTVGFIELESLLSMIKGTWGRREGQTEHNIITLAIGLDVLVIDDLGNESGEWAGKKLFEIINGRLGKQTIVTTNFMDMDELAERYPVMGGKIISRLHSNSKIVDVITEDMRMKKTRS